MKAVDHYTIHEVGIPSLVLMERAALAVADCALKAARTSAAHSPVWALCGVGNNGADAAAAARMVYLKGLPAVIFLAGSEEKATEELKLQLSIARKLGIPVKKWELMKEEAENCGILFDGLFGVGLSREIQGEYRACMELAAEILKGDGKTKPWCIAVDIPSGIHSGTGAVMGIALKADETVTFGWEKIGTAVYPGRDYAGNVTVADIGFPEEALRAEPEEEDPISMAYACEESDLNRVPERKAYSNKGTFGRVLIAAGSKNMSGAA